MAENMELALAFEEGVTAGMRLAEAVLRGVEAPVENPYVGAVQ